MFDQSESPAPEERPSIARPLIGVAICTCLAAISFQLGITTMCGPGSGGFNRGDSSMRPITVVAIVVLFGSLMGMLGCFAWFLFAVIDRWRASH